MWFSFLVFPPNLLPVGLLKYPHALISLSIKSSPRVETRTNFCEWKRGLKVRIRIIFLSHYNSFLFPVFLNGGEFAGGAAFFSVASIRKTISRPNCLLICQEHVRREVSILLCCPRYNPVLGRCGGGGGLGFFFFLNDRIGAYL